MLECPVEFVVMLILFEFTGNRRRKSYAGTLHLVSRLNSRQLPLKDGRRRHWKVLSGMVIKHNMNSLVKGTYLQP
jgi:hypothetical protein